MGRSVGDLKAVILEILHATWMDNGLPMAVWMEACSFLQCSQAICSSSSVRSKATLSKGRIAYNSLGWEPGDSGKGSMTFPPPPPTGE